MNDTATWIAVNHDWHQTTDTIRQLKRLRDLARDDKARDQISEQIAKHTQHARDLHLKIVELNAVSPEPDLYPHDMPGPHRDRWCVATGENLAYP